MKAQRRHLSCVERRHLSCVVIDLEFMAHVPNALVTALGYSWVRIDKETGKTEIIKGGGARLTQEQMERILENGGKVDEEVVEWALATGMNEILSPLPDLTNSFLEEMIDAIHNADWVAERSVGADIPKFDFLTSIIGDTPTTIGKTYWYKIKEVRSILDGASWHGLFRAFPHEFTAHNPYHDALVDSVRIAASIAFRQAAFNGTPVNVEKWTEGEGVWRTMLELIGVPIFYG